MASGRGINATLPAAQRTLPAILERQAAVVEQPAHLRLRIVDEPFVDDAVYASGQHGVEVRHQIDVVAVVATQLGQVVAHRPGSPIGLGHGEGPIDEVLARRVHRHLDTLASHLVQGDRGLERTDTASGNQHTRAHRRPP